MSVQFGRWNFEGQPAAPDYLTKVNAFLTPYGPDSDESYCNGGVNIIYRAFCTTREARGEKQPHICPSGAVITWDGCLDNRRELIAELGGFVGTSSTDSQIVAAGLEQWGTECLGKLIGDWALSVWKPEDRTLLLAKDPIGTHHLYYTAQEDHITWSTILDPLVLFGGRTFSVCEEYIAGWLAISAFPAPHLTPYLGINAVPPSTTVVLVPGKHTVRKYWDFDPDKKIRYRTNTEYEEHFRSVLFTAVRRKLRSDRPVLAELSGGMDSSSIVCMADLVIAQHAVDAPRLDTVSYYDDRYDRLEPDTNELRWIVEVEKQRGRTGHHINLSDSGTLGDGQQECFGSEFEDDSFAAVPFSSPCRSESFRQYAAYVKSRGHRVVLSGIGGSEFVGDGVPNSKLELQNLLARARVFALFRQLKSWSNKIQTSPLSLLWEAIGGFYASTSIAEEICTDLWLHDSFVQRNHRALSGYPFRIKVFGPLPSFQWNIGALKYIRRVLACRGPRPELLQDKRYPYLDRSLLEFMCAIPREQVVGVGSRRYLMKRALVGIVPLQLLKRRRKRFASVEPMENGPTEWRFLQERLWNMVSSSLGIIDQSLFWKVVSEADGIARRHSRYLRRTISLESWLRHIVSYGVVANTTAQKEYQFLSSVGADHPQASC